MTQAYNDMMMEYLSDYHGNFNERLYQYLYDLGYVEKTLPERIRSAEYKTSPDGTFKRDFLTLSGTTDYIQLDSVLAIVGDFELSITAQVDFTARTGHSTLMSGPGFRLQGQGTSTTAGNLWFEAPGITNVGNTGIVLPSNAPFTITVKRSGNSIQLIYGSNVYDVVPTISTSSMSLSHIFYNASGVGGLDIATGTPYKVEIYQGEVTNRWPINTAGDTILDVVGGNHGTLINGSSSDWERFEKAPGWDYWLGEELSSRDSVSYPPDYYSGGTTAGYWDIFDGVANTTYLITALLNQVAGTSGWSSQGGIPGSIQFRTLDDTPQVRTVGGIATVTSSVPIRLFNVQGDASFSSISARKVLL